LPDVPSELSLIPPHEDPIIQVFVG
jgi:hypothetical protein